MGEQPSRKDIHDVLAAVAAKNGAVDSVFQNGVSLHKLAKSVSFGQLKAFLEATKKNEARTFIGTLGGQIVVSVNFNFETSVESGATGTTGAPGARVGKKRGRDSVEDAVQAAVDRVKKGVNLEEVDLVILEHARTALYAMLTSLKGAKRETVVESWGLSYKKDDVVAPVVPTAQRPKLILSLKMTPSVAVPLKRMLELLGPHCNGDGMVSIKESSELASGFDLPLGDQARVAEEHGQKAMSLFATVF